jgi:hypothetical protein
LPQPAHAARPAPATLMEAIERNDPEAPRGHEVLASSDGPAYARAARRYLGHEVTGRVPATHAGPSAGDRDALHAQRTATYPATTAVPPGRRPAP